MTRAFHEAYPGVQIWFSHDEEYLQMLWPFIRDGAPRRNGCVTPFWD